MRTGPTITGILIFFGILFLIDLYVFSAVKTMTIGLEQRTRKYIHWAYWIINTGLFAWCTTLMLMSDTTKGMPRAFMTFMGIWVLFFVPKLVITLILGAEDVARGLRAIYAVGYNSISDNGGMSVGISRRQFLSRAAGFIALIPFAGIAHGIVSGRFRYRVRRETIYYDDLPASFDGFTITQISDIHIGSFDPETHREEVIAGIELAQQQNSDIFVFTGDMVNNAAAEMAPWKDEFKRLRSKHGQYSILGNHDYGDYIQWDTVADKVQNMKDLFATHAEIGFDLLLDRNVPIERNGEKIYLIGVENWGAGGFKQKGDLEKALQGVPDDAFKILLSHDPSHYDVMVSKHKTDIHLTLSGHTHGAQFGVEIPGIKFSPVQFRYSRWAGLYNLGKRFLYVNRGFGFLAFPGRVGIWPEVTVLTLKRKV
jgi:predicted MPP superfamily phosphohydrolase